jgi:intracellular sulfur oxidation DsrE/DsrF family protein
MLGNRPSKIQVNKKNTDKDGKTKRISRKGTPSGFLFTPRGCSLFIWFAIGLAGIVVTLSVPMLRTESTIKQIETVLYDVFGSLVTVLLVEYGIYALQKRNEQPDVKLFFGENIYNTGITFVFASAKVDMANMQHGNMPESVIGNAHPKGISRLIAHNDIRCSIAITRMCEELHIPVHTEIDTCVKDKELPRDTIISIGLGFNRATYALKEHSKVFDIFYHECRYFDSEQNKWDKKPDDNYDCALIARIIGKNGTPHFVCAGRTAEGSEAAGIFLASRWRDILGYYHDRGRDLRTDSMALTIRHLIGEERSGERAPSKRDYLDENPCFRK